MKKVIFLSLFLAGFLKSYSQNFNMVLGINPSNARELEVTLVPSNLIAPVNIQQITFTIQWPSSCGISLGNLSNLSPIGTNIGLLKDNLGEVTNTGVVSQMFYGNGSVDLSSLGSSYVVARIPITGNTSGCSFTVPLSYAPPYGNWYMYGSHNNGVVLGEMQGTVTSNASVVLPVELLSFQVDKSDEKSVLNWVSINEKGLEFYGIERSIDGKNFKVIDFAKPKAKTPDEKAAYSYLDEKPDLGINYYRLRMKDSNGYEKLSKVASIDFGAKIKAKTYPNPFSSDLSIEIDIEKNIKGDVVIDLLDMTGKIVQTKKLVAEGRRVSFNLPTDDLVPGSYVIRMQNGTNTWQQKITKQ